MTKVETYRCFLQNRNVLVKKMHSKRLLMVNKSALKSSKKYSLTKLRMSGKIEQTLKSIGLNTD